MVDKKINKFEITFRFPTELFPKETAILQKAISILPGEVIEHLKENPVMFSAENEGHRARAWCLSHDDFKDYKNLIHFNYHIWKDPEELIIETIYHEIAHCYLGHKAGGLLHSKSKKYISNLENEVDRLVNKWLERYKDSMR
jgi:hypothetical protein